MGPEGPVVHAFRPAAPRAAAPACTPLPQPRLGLLSFEWAPGVAPAAGLAAPAPTRRAADCATVSPARPAPDTPRATATPPLPAAPRSRAPAAEAAVGSAPETAEAPTTEAQPPVGGGALPTAPLVAWLLAPVASAAARAIAAPPSRAMRPASPAAPLRRPAAALAALVMLAALALMFAGPAAAQSVTVDLGDGGGSLTARLAQLFVLVTLLSLAPGLAIMVTCFPFMVTTLSILRQAIGVQQAPPNMMIVSLALFLTWFVMEPVAQESWREGVQPLIEGTIPEEEGVARAFEPFRVFMEGRVDPDTLAVMIEASPGRDALAEGARPPASVLIPAYLISEIQRGFEVGFLIFLPFLIIDLVIASVLMSMGMMMVPPAVVALPFKLAFFVIADGWTLLAGALVRGYAT